MINHTRVAVVEIDTSGIVTIKFIQDIQGAKASLTANMSISHSAIYR